MTEPAAAAELGGPVHLGYVGRRLGGEDQRDVRLSRIGGAPSWSGERIPAALAAATCELCGGPSPLVGQFFAGYGEAPRRLLYVFCCTSAGCSSDRRAWTALRSIGPGDQESAPSAAAAAAAAAPSASRPQAAPSWEQGGLADEDWSAPAASDDWGAPACLGAVAGGDWGAAGGSVPSDAELDALLQVTASASAAPVAPQAPAAPVGASAGGEDEAWLGLCADGGAGAWPCFALEIYDEPPALAKSGEHERELLERYLKSDLAKDDACAETGASGLPPEVQRELEEASMKTDTDVDEEERDFGEDDDAEADGSGPAGWLQKFQRRVQRSPWQVVRYDWGGTPLWLAPPPAEVRRGEWPPCCEHCGADRTFEVQLLPTLLSQMQGAVPGLDAEWGAVAVYTCSRDCSAREPSREFVVVQPAV